MKTFQQFLAEKAADESEDESEEESPEEVEARQQAQLRTAWEAGWNDPSMDVYDRSPHNKQTMKKMKRMRKT